MPVTITLAPEERDVFGFTLDRTVAFYRHGTAEQRESAETLARMLAGFLEAPPGAVELEFLTQDAYLVGLRIYATSLELEDYWLDAQERALGRRLPPADSPLQASVERFFPILAAEPLAWDFQEVRGIFIELGFRLDRGVTAVAPRARGMYNGDKTEVFEAANELHERRARAREDAAVATPERGSVVVAESPAQEHRDWGVDVPTGLAPDDIPLDSFRSISVGSVTVLITNFGGRLGAIAGTCSHQQASLVKGRVEGSRISCPRHGAEFDLRSGTQLCPPFCPRWMEANGMKARVLKAVTPDRTGGDLPVYPLRVENGEIIVRI